MPQAVPLAPPDASPALRLVMLGVPLLLMGLAFVPDPDWPGIHWDLLALGALLAALFGLAPRRLAYTLTPDALVIRRVLGRTTLPYAGMRARRSAGRLGVRTFGTGLPGYLTGRFTFGPDPRSQVRAAATRGEGGVVVEVGGAAHFLTPADPAAFLSALEARGAAVSP
ncbi:PH domain-containing protein [Deinococcus budaensis]|uniref:Bacterial Pleckstrin homology domain-containing protein n=1 Tax=Deinococcus budaensis TaxID=1665626 RepID=A0A7W8GDH0_9DEIO|nr:PH domain-containing protein [Deinococcus budaensis]MBB5233488.1 hypothetical protein [Deinococcus budaensis]